MIPAIRNINPYRPAHARSITRAENAVKAIIYLLRRDPLCGRFAT
jgi:hypothetical protein